MAGKGRKMNREFLEQQLQLADKASEVLRLSYQRISKRLPLSIDLQDDLLIELDALTSRFARMSDILIQKVFRAVDAIELVDEGSILDRLNRAEKRSLISSAQQWREIRLLRNQIAHEYVLNDLRELFEQTIANTSELLSTLDRVKQYANSQL